jgi:hypothetical protein
MIMWVLRELGRPCRLHRKGRPENRAKNSRLIHSYVLSCWGRTRDETMVSPNEGNEVRRDGRPGVAAPHSSVETGERPFRTPWSEGGAALWTGSWNHAEDIVPHQRVTAKRASRVRDSDTPQRDEPGAFNAHARICGTNCSSSHTWPGAFGRAYHRIAGATPIGGVVPGAPAENSARRINMRKSRTAVVPPRAEGRYSVNPFLSASG